MAGQTVTPSVGGNNDHFCLSCANKLFILGKTAGLKGRKILAKRRKREMRDDGHHNPQTKIGQNRPHASYRNFTLKCKDFEPSFTIISFHHP